MAELPDSTYGAYILVSELGRSPWAVTYVARDRNRGTNVIIKVFNEDLSREPGWHTVLDKTLETLYNHPLQYVPRLLDWAVQRGRLYIVNEFISAVDLRHRVTDKGKRLSQIISLMIIRDVAEALEAARKLNIVHGSIKPANILLPYDGNALLADFGILPALQSTTLLREIYVKAPAFNSVAPYVAPEFFVGGELTPASDVYSLSAVLYEMLTGRLAFGGKTVDDVRRQQLAGSPPDVRDVRPDLAASLAAVLQRGLNRDPGQRYRHAEEFFQGLREAIGEGELVGAEPSPVVGVSQNLPPDDKARFERLLDQQRQAERARQLAETELERLKGAAQAAETLLLQFEREEQEMRKAVTQAAETRQQAEFHMSGTRMRAARAQRVWRLLAQGQTAVELEGIQVGQILVGPGPVYALAFQPLTDILVTAGNDQALRFWHVSDCTPAGVIPGGARLVTSLAFSVNGNLFATSSHDGSVRIWSAEEKQLVRELRGHSNSVYRVGFSPDGELLVSGSQDATARIWRVSNGDPLALLPGHRDWAYGVAFSPIEHSVATAGADKLIRLWNVEDRRKPRCREFEVGHEMGVLDVAFSPEGDLLASGSQDKTAALWDVKEGKRLRVLDQHESSVRRVQFSPDGSLLATACIDDVVTLWRVSDGSLVRQFRPHQGSVQDIAFSPDGTVFATCGDDGVVRLWT